MLQTLPSTFAPVSFLFNAISTSCRSVAQADRSSIKVWYNHLKSAFWFYRVLFSCGIANQASKSRDKNLCSLNSQHVPPCLITDTVEGHDKAELTCFDLVHQQQAQLETSPPQITSALSLTASVS